MKTIKSFSWIVLVNICLSLFLAIMSCSKEDPRDYESKTAVSEEAEQSEKEWMTFLEELNFESIILVQKKDVITDALKEASEGDVIFVEAGTYQEKVILEQPHIALIGVEDDDNEKVVISSPDGNKPGISIHEFARNSEVINIQDPTRSRNAEMASMYPPHPAKRSNRFIRITRTELCSGIAHYQFKVRVGQGPFDIVRIHRVVKENRPYKPVRTSGNVFMVHGSSQDFDDIFLRPGVENATTQNSSPAYLASKNIDVWGIDLGWTLVPEATTDFNFMQDWGVETDAAHVLKAMSIARLVRGLTRQGFGRLNLLGFSYGVSVAYAAAGRETQQHHILRDVIGLVAAEGAMKYAPEDETYRLLACERAAGAQSAYNEGVYQTSNGVSFKPIGELALTAADEESPFNPNVTNAQFAMFLGAVPSPSPPAPDWHFLAGKFEGGVPVDLLYTDPVRWFKLLASLAPHQPVLNGLDVADCQCDEKDVAIDDFLSEIQIPILYLGAAGGYGQQGLYTSSLTNSNDITFHIVSEQTDSNRLIDHGHADIFMGNAAQNLSWDFLSGWLKTHSRRY
ncbi:MAG: hypothetical protein KJN76_10630 [Eudoraea sp.]|nr:hypothetical protein [Eudoraea sp.]